MPASNQNWIVLQVVTHANINDSHWLDILWIRFVIAETASHWPISAL